MPVRHIVLAATSVAVLGALVLLLVEVRASPQIEIPEAALAEARARYQRSQSPAERVASPEIPAPPRRPPPRPPVASQPTPDPAATPPVPPDDMDPSTAAAVERMEQLREREEMRPEIRERRERLRQYHDEGNYEMALREARALLPEAPTNRYVMRVAVTSACALGEKAIAASYYGQLFRDEDRRIVRVRCARYGIEF